MSSTGIRATTKVVENHLGWRGDVLSDEHMEDAFALHMWGGDHRKSSPSDDGRGQDVGDYSGQERYLTKVGTPVIDFNSVLLTPDNYYYAPYSGDEIAEENGEMTLWAIGTFPNSNSAAITNYSANFLKSVLLGTGNANTYIARADQASTAPLSIGLPTDAYHTTGGPEFIAMTATDEDLWLHRIQRTGGLLSARVDTTLPPGGPGLIRFGRSYSASTYLGGLKLHAAGAATTAKSSAGIISLRNGLRDRLAALPHPVYLDPPPTP